MTETKPSQSTCPNEPPSELQNLCELILRSAGEGIYGLDANGITTFVNAAATKMLGCEAADFVGKPQPEAIHRTMPDGTPCTPETCPIYASVTRGAVHRIDQETFWRKDGTSFPVEYSSTPIKSEAGVILGAVVTFNDITDRRQKERELATLRRHNESILGSAGEGIYGLDIDGLTTFVNPAAAAILGWSAEELLGKPQHDIIHHTKLDGSDYPRHQCPIYAAFTDGAVHRVDDELFWRKDGTSIPVEYVSTPVRDENGELVGAVVTFNDITERKNRERALSRALVEVEELKERLEAENTYLREEIEVSHNFEEMIGSSGAMHEAKRLIEQVAVTDATVLILGETGVGKELFARAIHNLSARRERPLVKVNCAALPSTLIESELFGHEKGAYTGATTQRAGRFELADGGTIFLDEIGELPLELQAKLLRVIQEAEFERLGGTRTIRVDIRIVAATHRDLSRMVLSGEFRDDLYYRLNVFPVKVPALRARKEDIPPLVAHFVKKFSSKIGKRIESIPQRVQERLRQYDWPGNIRELENVIERAVILARGSALRIDGFADLPTQEMDADAMSSAAPDAGTEVRSIATSLEEVERAHILSVLKQTLHPARPADQIKHGEPTCFRNRPIQIPPML